jgi:hypothetical protein
LLVSSMVFAAADSAYMRVNDQVITQKEFTAYKEFISRFVPKEKSSDPKLMQAEVENYVTELMLVKAAAKAEGHAVTDEMLGRELSSLASQNNITVDELKENMAKDKIDPKLFAEYQVMGQLLQEVIKLQFEGSFAPEQAQVSAKKKELTHDQVDLNMAFINEKVATKEDKQLLAKALKQKKAQGKAEFNAISWNPIEAFPEKIRSELKKLKVKQVSSAQSLEGRTVMFQVIGKRKFTPSDAQVKNVLLNEYLAVKRTEWLETAKKEARVALY